MARNLRLALGAAALAVSAISSQAHADIIYTYTSPTFAGTFTPTGSGPQAILLNVDLELRFDDHVSDGTILVNSTTLKSWALDISPAFTGETGTFNDPTGQLFVQGGKVVDWTISFSGGNVSNFQFNSFNATLTPGSDEFGYAYGSIRGGAPFPLGQYTGDSQLLGTWVVAVPETATYGLALAGLMMVAASARAGRQRAASL